MKPHPDFCNSALSREATLGAFRLTPLSPAYVDEDLKAVTGSERVLCGLFGDDWPKGLTREENAVDLAWHKREFTAKRSFAWIIRDQAGTYLGCAYLYPDLGARGRAEVTTWMCDTPGRVERLSRFNAAFSDWLAPLLPEGYALRRSSTLQSGNDTSMPSRASSEHLRGLKKISRDPF